MATIQYVSFPFVTGIEHRKIEPKAKHCRRSGNGGPQTCLPAAYGVAQGMAQHDPSSSAGAQDPREWPSLMGRTIGSFLRGSLIRQAREEAERSR